MRRASIAYGHAQLACTIGRSSYEVLREVVLAQLVRKSILTKTNNTLDLCQVQNTEYV